MPDLDVAEPEWEILKLCIGNFVQKNRLTRPVRSSSDVAVAFNKLAEGLENEEVSASIIGYYLEKLVSGRHIRKKHASGDNFERFVDLFLGTGEQNRSIVPAETRADQNSIQYWIALGRRKKNDVRIGDLLFSVKTLMPNNQELNVGSFAWEGLSRGIWGERVGERRQGLGSSAQLLRLFREIDSQEMWPRLQNRFDEMVRGIFCDSDWIIAVKEGDKLNIWFISKQEFINHLTGSFHRGPEGASDVIQRFEGHALRLKLPPILEWGENISLSLRNDVTPIIHDFLRDCLNSQLQKINESFELENLTDLRRYLRG